MKPVTQINFISIKPKKSMNSLMWIGTTSHRPVCRKA